MSESSLSHSSTTKPSSSWITQRITKLQDIFASLAQAKLDTTITSDAPSPPSSEPASRGQKLIDHNLKNTLLTVWQTNVTTKSDFAREWADYIAMAASMGLITTRVAGEVYSRHWQITSYGLAAIEEDTEDGQEKEG